MVIKIDTLDLLILCIFALTWFLIGGALRYHFRVYSRAARRRRFRRIARQVQAEMDAQGPYWWERYLTSETSGTA